jgi:ribosome-binding factor A
MIPNRLKRVNNELRHIVSDMLLRDMKDPRISGFVTITDVVTAKDLRTARIYVSIMESEEKRAEILERLNAASHYMRKRIREESRLRAVPIIHFFHDNSIERGVRVAMLIDEISKKEPNT